LGRFRNRIGIWITDILYPDGLAVRKFVIRVALPPFISKERYNQILSLITKIENSVKLIQEILEVDSNG